MIFSGVSQQLLVAAVQELEVQEIQHSATSKKLLVRSAVRTHEHANIISTFFLGGGLYLLDWLTNTQDRT